MPAPTLEAPAMTASPVYTELLNRLEARTATIAVVGMGYVGLPLAVCVAKAGFKAIGFDIGEKRVAQLNQGESYITDVTTDELAPLVANGSVTATTEMSRLAEADVVVICVPTPLTPNQTPDITYIEATGQTIAQYLRPGQLVTLESTTYPGTTEEVLQPILETSGLTLGIDFFLAYSPERVDPGNERYTTHNTNKVLGGVTPACLQAAKTFYQSIIQNIVAVSSPGCAEMVKVFENTFRAVNIALVNELALLCDPMSLNIWEVVEAAGTKPFGMMTFYPGPGVGGHCIPIDPFYLAWKAREYKFQTRFIELAGEINNGMPRFVREKVIRALGKQRKSVAGSTIMLLGMAYKKDLGDWRDSPAVDVFEILQGDDANVIYHDPYVPTMTDHNGQSHSSVSLTTETLSKVDCVVIVTDHTCVDTQWVVENSSLVVDTRNATKAITGPLREKIVLL